MLITKIRVILKDMNVWGLTHFLQIMVFNFILIILFVLRSAGYFSPYFPLTIYLIVFISLVLSIFLLGARSKALFAATIAFWLFAGILRIIGINVWAERTSIYAFQSFGIGLVVLFCELAFFERKK